MKIIVKTLKGTRFKIKVKPNDSVAKVKKNIETVLGDSAYPAAQQILIHKGKVLRDETTMEVNRVYEKSVIAIMMTKAKAAPPPRFICVPASVPKSATATEYSSPLSILTPLPSTAHTSAATSSLVPESTSEIESSIQQMLEMGGGNWDRELVTYVLHKAYYNPERAVEYLYSGIPMGTANPLPMPQTQEPATPLPQTHEPAAPAAARPEPEGCLEEMGKQNPPLLEMIRDNKSGVIRVPNEEPFERGNELAQPEQDLLQLQVTVVENEAIKRLEAMGFERRLVLEAFFACNKNEELAANYLLDHIQHS